MKPRIFTMFVVIVSLALLLTWSTAAQRSEPPIQRPVTSSGDLEPQSANVSAVSMGQPGLSFRYVQTFGVTEQAYTSDAQHLNGPDGLYIDGSGNLYVVEGAGGRMLKFNSSGNLVLSIGKAGYNRTGDTTFDTPRSVVADGSGNIWVTDSNRVMEYDMNGTYLRNIGDWWSSNDQTHFDTPRGLAVNAGRLYVSDTNNHRVQVYQLVSGSPVYSTTIGVTGVSGFDNSHFDQPAHIAFDSSSRLYVVDTANYRVQRCTFAVSWTCSTFFGVTGTRGNDLTHMDWAFGLTIDSSDNVFIADGLNYRVLKCNTSGVCAHLTGTTGERGWDNAHFWWPADVAIDPSGNVYVSDYDNHRIQKFTSAGAYAATIGVTGVPYVVDTNRYNSPNGIVVASDGSIYFTENRGYRLVKLNAAGAQQWVIGEAGVYGADNLHFGDYWSGPEGTLAIDTSGRIYVPDTGNRRVQIFNPDGSYYATMGVTRVSGSDNAHFDCPMGVAISPVNGDIYVADQCSHRVQVFDSSRVYKATLGVTRVSGSDNAHFNQPRGVAVDASSNIYVADANNHRVQIFNSSFAWQATWGTAGQCTGDFDHFCKPSHIAIGANGNIYVSDQDNARVQVFDSNRAYLTTVGGVYSNGTNQFRRLGSIAVDSAGNLYVTDYFNQRIQKFAPGVPGWRQVNINGFGDVYNSGWMQAGVSGGYLYMGASNYSTGGELWRSSNGITWTQVNTNGFGDTHNTILTGITEFGGYLYVGTRNETAGSQVWRSADGTQWTQANNSGFGDINNQDAEPGVVFGGYLYVDTTNSATGCEVWRTANGTSWNQVNSDGFGDAHNVACSTQQLFNGSIYVGTYNPNTGGELWRSSNGTDWSQVGGDGFGDANNRDIVPLVEHGGYLYASTMNTSTGVEIWRSTNGTTWEQVNTDGFGSARNTAAYDFMAAVLNNELYVAVENSTDGMQIWKTRDSSTWSQVLKAGFGDSNNTIGTLAVLNGSLYIGTQNNANGGEVWQMLNMVYLPLVLRN